MKCYFTICSFIVVGISLFSAPQLRAEKQGSACSSVVKDIPIKNVFATAATFANLRKKPGSINFESNAIFQTAKEQAEKLSAPENFCPPGCFPAKRGAMYFSSVPSKLLSDYGDSAHCNDLLKNTSQQPLIYQNSQITGIKDLNAWIGDLSQGDGTEGKDLYKKCDASCSPQYHYFISRNSDKPVIYTVRASIICGPARDKDDNQYELKSFFRWSCQQS